MKRWLVIIAILLAGTFAALWMTRSKSPRKHRPGRLLSAESLARLRISGGSEHALAISADGSLWSWGMNSSALGLGRLEDPVTAPQRLGKDKDWAEISAGYSHSLAIKHDGSLWAWGSNPSGALGDGTEKQRDQPVRVGSDTSWLIAAPGIHHSAGLKRDGTIWAWGNNMYGQLGSPALATTSTNTAFVPIQVGTETNWQDLAVGSLANTAIRRDGTLWTWGDGTRTPTVVPGVAANNFTPIQLGTETNWVAVASGYYHFLALQSDGSLWSWGRNGHMIGGIPAPDPSQPRRFKLGTNWVGITDGAYGNFARQRDGSWHQLGRLPLQSESVAIPGQWWQLAQGSGFSLAVDQDGSLWHWGAVFAEKKRPGWFKSALSEALNAMGRQNHFGQAFTPNRSQPEQIFVLPDEPAKR